MVFAESHQDGGVEVLEAAPVVVAPDAIDIAIAAFSVSEGDMAVVGSAARVERFAALANAIMPQMIVNNTARIAPLLNLAAQHPDSLAMLRTLLERGAPINGGGAGHTPLDKAISNHNLDAMALLLVRPEAVCAETTLRNLFIDEDARSLATQKLFITHRRNFQYTTQPGLEGATIRIYLLEVCLERIVLFSNGRWSGYIYSSPIVAQLLEFPPHPSLGSPPSENALQCNQHLLNKFYLLSSEELRRIRNHIAPPATLALGSGSLQDRLCQKIDEILYPTIGARMLSGILLLLAAIPLAVQYAWDWVHPRRGEQVHFFTKRDFTTRWPGVSKLYWRQISEINTRLAPVVDNASIPDTHAVPQRTGGRQEEIFLQSYRANARLRPMPITAAENDLEPNRERAVPVWSSD